MPRQVFLLGIGIALIGLAFVATNEALGPPPGVTRLNFNRIRQGMSMKEVESLLGSAPDEGPHPGWRLVLFDDSVKSVHFMIGGSYIWCGEEEWIYIEFNDELRVQSVTINPSPVRRILEMLRERAQSP